MRVETIAIGNEVLNGHTINSNAAYIAKRMQELGITTSRHSIVGDDEKAIIEAIYNGLEKADILFCIGGLGPTQDDLTKEAVCKAIHKELICHEPSLNAIKKYFADMGKEMPQTNEKQAYFPKDAHVLPNNHGTAPGCKLTYKNKSIYLLPGPPKELFPMFEEGVIPLLKDCIQMPYIVEEIQLFGIGESHLAQEAGDLLGQFDEVEVAPYVGNHEIVIRLRGKSLDIEETKAKISSLKNSIITRLKPYVIGYNQSKLEETVVHCLSEQNLTVATAESCTGGMVASTLINCSGVSEFFKEGMITYSNEAKIKRLGVTQATLDEYGAVSAQTAHEMAIGIQKEAGTDIGLSTTGIAGPGGGSESKPVGLVYIGIAIGDEVYTKEVRLKGTRQSIREKATKYVLYELYKLLKK